MDTTAQRRYTGAVQLNDADLRAVFGAHLRAARKAAGLTQAELGQRIGISGAAVCRIERGSAQVEMLAIVRLGDALGVDVVELIPRTPKSATVAHAAA